MKRCPQCDFIYENEQGLCDMDGRELVYDETALLVPRNVSLLARPAKPGRRSRWMSYAVLPVGGVALGASLFLINHALTPQATPPPHNAARPSDAAHFSNVAQASARVAALPTPSPDASTAPRDDADDASATRPRPDAPTPATDVKANDRTNARRAPTPATAAAGREEKRSKSENAKKESKLGSILKKTGRVLKKPFRF